MKYIFFSLIFSAFLFLLPDNTYAYLDPGTGSYIFQIFIAAILGSLFAIKIFWKRIISFLKNLFSKKS